MADKVNDFLATLVKNPDLTISDLKANNITPDNSSFLSKEEYKNMPEVQQAFVDKATGKFNETLFDNYYDNASILYSNYDQLQFLDNLTKNYEYDDAVWWKPKDTPRVKDNPIIVVNTAPNPVSSSIRSINEISSPASELSIRELAQTQPVVDYETGEELGYTPNDKSGLFAMWRMPALVLAQYEENGTHIENGEEVAHLAGQFKLRNGMPYYETLGDRDAIGKIQLHASEVLTVDGSSWNQVDFFDSDDKEKGALKTTLSLIAKVAPLFIPYVGEIYGYINAVDSIIRVMPVIGKMVNGLITQDNSNKIGKFFSQWESFAAKWDTSSSDYGTDHFVSYEGFANLVGDISTQLFEQKAVASLPALLHKFKKVENIENLSTWGKRLSYAYMAATSSQDTYNIFKQAGASDLMASLGMMANLLALYKLMDINYFRENALKGTFMDESEVRGTMAGVAKETAGKFKDQIIKEGSKDAAKFVDEASNFYYNTLLAGMSEKGFVGIFHRSLSEAAEETMEEVSIDLIKGFTEALNALGFNVTEPEKQLNFGWSVEDFATRYGMSFAGGFLGGAIFAGQHRYEKWLNKVLYDVNTINPTNTEKLIYYLATGRRSEIDYYLEKFHDRGLLGSKNLSVDLTQVTDLDGKSKYVPTSKGMSQNDAVYYTLKSTLDMLQQSIEAEVPDMRFMTTEGLQKLETLGYDLNEVSKHPRLLTASTIMALQDYNSFQNDLFKTLDNIIRVKSELEARIDELTNGNAKTEDERKTKATDINKDPRVKKLQEELKKYRAEKDAFFNGEKNAYYSGQALFAADKELHKYFINLSLDDYTKIKYGRNFNSYNEEDQIKIREEHVQYTNTEGRNNIYRAFDLYLTLAQQHKTLLTKEAKNLLKNARKKNFVPELQADIDYYKNRQEANKLTEEFRKLQSIEDRTDVQEQRIVEIGARLNELDREYSFYKLHPGLLTASRTKDSVTEYWKSLDEKEHLFDDLSSQLYNEILDKRRADGETNVPDNVNSVSANEILNVLRESYRRNVKNKQYRYDDSELNTFYKEIVRGYLNMGGANTALTKFLEKIEGGGFFPEFEKDDFDVLSGTTGILDYAGDHSELIRIINSIVKTIGVDNNAAFQYVRELESYLQQNTKLLNPENASLLKTFYDNIFPTINNLNILEIAREFDNYRKNINYSVYYNLVERIGSNIKDVNLLQLLQQQILNLIDSDNIEMFLIKDKDIEQALDVKSLNKILNLIDALVLGSSNGFNEIMNNFKMGNPLDLPVIEKLAGDRLLQQSAELRKKLQFILDLNEINKGNTLQEHINTQINMRPKWIRGILNVSDSIKLKFHVDVEDIWKRVSNGLQLNEIRKDNYEQYEKVIIDFEQEFYEEFRRNNEMDTDDDIETIANNLIELFNKDELYKSKSTKISSDADAPIESLDLLYHIASLISLPSKSFYSAYKTTFDEVNNGKKIIPIYGQEYVIKQTLAQLINHKLFNKILTNVYDVEYAKDKEYLENKQNLYNLATILGGAGVGKTVGILNKLISLITEVDAEFVIIAKEQSQADKAKANSGIEVQAYSEAKICQKLFGKEPEASDFVYDDDNGHVVSSSFTSRIGNVFNNDSGFKIYIIDEIETLTEPILAALSASALVNNEFIIGMGDLKQPSTDLTIKDKKGKVVTHSSGIEDCNFVRTPILTTSMRAKSGAKIANTEILGNALEFVLEEVSENPGLTLDDRNSSIERVLKSTKLYYWEDKKTGEVVGDMVVASGEFSDKLQKIINLGKEVLIITDNVGNYSKYNSNSKVKVIDYNERAGVEAEYVFVDVDLTKYNSRNNKTSLYLLTRDLYTLTQRSEIGTVIKSDTELDYYKFEFSESKKHIVDLGSKSKDDYLNWKKESLNAIEGKEDGLKVILNSSSLVNRSSGVVSTTTTSTPSTPSTPTSPSTPSTPSIPTSTTSSTPTPVTTTPPSTVAPTTSTSSVPTPSVSTPSTPATSTPVPSTPTPSTPSVPAPSISTVPEKTFGAYQRYIGNGEPIKTAYEFLDVIAELFPLIENDIQNLKTSPLLDGISTAEELISNKNILEEICTLIDKKYETGRGIVRSMFKRPNGFNDEKFINAVSGIREKNNTPVKKKVIIVSKTDRIGDTKTITDLIESDKFFNWSKTLEDNVNEYHGVNKVTGLDRKSTKHLIKEVGSEIRTSLYLEDEDWELTNFTLQTSDTYLLEKYDSKPELWIVRGPENNTALLVSRFYANDNTYFDIPVLYLTNVNTYGKYNGSIILKSALVAEKTDTHIPLSEFEKTYRVTCSKQAVIEGKHGDIDKDSEAYVTRNMGKTMSGITDEPAIARYIFDRDSNYSIFHNHNGKTVLEYEKYLMMGTECLIKIPDFIKLIKHYTEKLGFSLDEGYLLKTNKEESSEEIKSDIIDNYPLLFTKDGKVRQLLPKERAGILISLGLLFSKDSRFYLLGKMNPLSKSEKYRNLYTLTLNYSGQRYTLAFIENNGERKLVVGEYIKSTGDFDIQQELEFGGNFDLADISRQLVNNPDAIPELTVTYNSFNTEKNSSYVRQISNNELLALTFSHLSDSQISDFIEFIKNYDTPFKYGIYMEDRGIRDNTVTDSCYLILDTGGREYYTDYKVTEYSTYVIDQNKIEPTTEQPKNTLSLVCNQLGLASTTLDEANKELLDKSIDWKHNYIVFENNEYQVKTFDDDNLQNWLEYKYHLEDLTTDDVETFKMIFNAPGVLLRASDNLVIYKNGTILITTKENINTIDWNSTQELINNLPNNEILRNYIVGQLMTGKLPFDTDTNRNEILKLMTPENLDLVQIIINFEDQLNC